MILKILFWFYSLVDVFIVVFVQSSRTIDEHVPLSRAPPSSVVPTGEVDRNLASNLYTSRQPPLPVSVAPRNLQTPSKLPTTQTNSSEGSRVITTNSVPEKVSEKETWRADDFTDIDLKKKNRETIDECPICLEGMFCFYHSKLHNQI